MTETWDKKTHRKTQQRQVHQLHCKMHTRVMSSCVYMFVCVCVCVCVCASGDQRPNLINMTARPDDVARHARVTSRSLCVKAIRAEAFLITLHLGAIALGTIKEALDFRDYAADLEFAHSFVETFVVVSPTPVISLFWTCRSRVLCPVQVNGSCILAQVNGCCIPAQVQRPSQNAVPLCTDMRKGCRTHIDLCSGQC